MEPKEWYKASELLKEYIREIIVVQENFQMCL